MYNNPINYENMQYNNNNFNNLNQEYFNQETNNSNINTMQMNNMPMNIGMPPLGMNKPAPTSLMIKKQKGFNQKSNINITESNNTNINPQPSKQRKKSQMVFQKDSKDYEIDLEKIDSINAHKTTVMIRNIPNKYTQDLMLDRIDRNFKGEYDFFYLPIDFKNKCNVGYAFINFQATNSIKPFYTEFNKTKWEKFH